MPRVKLPWAHTTPLLEFPGIFVLLDDSVRRALRKSLFDSTLPSTPPSLRNEIRDCKNGAIVPKGMDSDPWDLEGFKKNER